MVSRSILGKPQRYVLCYCYQTWILLNISEIEGSPVYPTLHLAQTITVPFSWRSQGLSGINKHPSNHSSCRETPPIPVHLFQSRSQVFFFALKTADSSSSP